MWSGKLIWLYVYKKIPTFEWAWNEYVYSRHDDEKEKDGEEKKCNAMPVTIVKLNVKS